MKTTSPEQQIPHEVFGDFMERHSYDSMKDCILQPDLKAWKPSTVDGKRSYLSMLNFQPRRTSLITSELSPATIRFSLMIRRKAVWQSYCLRRKFQG